MSRGPSSRLRPSRPASGAGWGATRPTDVEEEALGPDESPRLPPRRRLRLLTPGTALLAALMTCAIGFYAGVRIEKGQLASSSSATASRTVTSLRSARAGAAGRFAGLFAGGAGAAAGGAAARGGSASFGTVASVSGRSLDVTVTSGNTVKVTLSSQTKVTKTVPVAHGAIHPGDTVAIQGVPGNSGSISAASITDSGARSAGTGASSTGNGSGGASSGGGSGVSSLFSGGG
jgi:hypothetical protein